MRFLILTQYFEPEVGAPQVRLGALARALVARGHDVEVVTGMPNHPEGRIRDGYRGRWSMTEQLDGITVRRVWLYAATGAGLRRLLNYSSFAATCVAGLVRARRPDVIFVESPPPFLMVPARVAATIWRRPIVMNVADLWPDAARALGLLDDGLVLRALLAYERWSYRAADVICAVTDGVRAVLEQDKRVPAGKLVDLPNGADTTMFAPGDGDAPVTAVAASFGVDAADVFLYAGTVGYAHGVETAVDAMALLRATHPGAHLLIVGGGSAWDAVARRVEQVGATNVTMAGPVPLSTVAELLRASRAAVSVIRAGGLLEGVRPAKLFPAMASGVPILYSGAGEGARIVADADAGLVVPPEDPGALADAMRRLLDDPAAARAMGEAGRRLAVARFSWASIADRWLAELAPHVTGRAPARAGGPR